MGSIDRANGVRTKRDDTTAQMQRVWAGLHKKWRSATEDQINDATQHAFAEMHGQTTSGTAIVDPIALGLRIGGRYLSRELGRSSAPVESSGPPAIVVDLEEALDIVAGRDESDTRPQKRRGGRQRAPAATATDISGYAVDKLKQLTEVAWKSSLEKEFKDRIGPARDYSQYNDDITQATRLLRALDAALTYAGEGGPCFKAWVIDVLSPFMEEHADSLASYGRVPKRNWSADLRLIRCRNLVRPGKAWKLDELTAVSILLGHKVEPKPGRSAAAYFNDHRKRINKLRKDDGRRRMADSRCRAAAQIKA